MKHDIRIIFRYVQCAALGAGVLVLAGCAGVNVKDTTRTFHTVVIDAGHGGYDSGAVKRGVAEKRAALDVAQRLDQKLRAAGFRTVMTRNGDYFVPLNTRAAISNRQSNAVFVSVHFNDARNRRVQGAQTYYYSPVSLRMARCIQRRLDGIAVDGGVHTARFRVLRLNDFPAVLVECGFLSNGREAHLAKTEGYRDQLASSIAAGVIESRR
jgi:N-acetylmuramoyl-L-alanine amidase